MIKVGIDGGDTPMAGELLRLLVHHPDVEIVAVSSRSRGGVPVCDVHHGLFGELDLRFTETLNPDDLEVVFADCMDPADRGALQSLSFPEDLPLIDMTHAGIREFEGGRFAYGLSEANRRTLAKHSRRAIVPHSVSAIILIAVAPLAAAGKLGSTIDVRLECAPEFATPEKIALAREEVIAVLRKMMPDSEVDLRISASGGDVGPRGLRATVDMMVPMDLAAVTNMFEERYSDHAFTFISSGPRSSREVEGTQKCILNIRKGGEDGIRIEAIGDCRMRGGAGDAVHIMNLFFGLQEKTGLYLKASSF